MNQRFLAVCSLVAALPLSSAWAESPALMQLQAQAGDSAVQVAAPAARGRAILPPEPEELIEYDSDDAPPLPPGDIPAPGYVQPMVVCTMSLRYREVDDQIPFPILNIIRFAKHIDGTAMIVCPDRRIPLRIHGDGFAPALGIPNGLFNSVNGFAAGDIEVRLPTAFEPKQLEGTYHSIGGEILGVGGSLSPWVNSDASIDFKFYLPTTLNLSVGFDITKLELRLM